MNFCSQCGAAVRLLVPAGDNRPRHVCETCGVIHYQNPKIVAGCIPEWQGQVLLCRRAIEPRYGLWTLPAGFMENGESAVAAALREAQEEANAVVENPRLYGLYSLIHVSQVYLMFLGQLKEGFASAGEETLEVRLFAEAETMDLICMSATSSANLTTNFAFIAISPARPHLHKKQPLFHPTSQT